MPMLCFMRTAGGFVVHGIRDFVGRRDFTGILPLLEGLQKKIFVEFKFSCYDMFMTLLPGLLVTVMIILACLGVVVAEDTSSKILMDSLTSLALYSVIASYYFFFAMGLITNDNRMEENLLQFRRRKSYIYLHFQFLCLLICRYRSWPYLQRFTGNRFRSVAVTANQIKGQ